MSKKPTINYELRGGKRDVWTFKRSAERLKSDKLFHKKVSDVKAAMEDYIFGFEEILRRFVDNIYIELLAERPYSRAVVISILRDEEFIAYMIEASLLNRLLRATFDTMGTFKLRLYYAILCFDDYKKQNWCD